MTEHTVLIAGGGPTGLMLAGELALSGASTSRSSSGGTSQDLMAAGPRTAPPNHRWYSISQDSLIGFLWPGKEAQVAGDIRLDSFLDINDFPTRYPYGLTLAGRTTSSAFWPTG